MKMKLMKASVLAAGLLLANTGLMASEKELFSINGGYSQASFDGATEDQSTVTLGLKYNVLGIFGVNNPYLINARLGINGGSDYSASHIGIGAGYKYSRIYAEAFVEKSDMTLSSSISASGVSYGAEIEYTFYKTDDKIKYMGLLHSSKYMTNGELGVGLRYRTTNYSYDLSILGDTTVNEAGAYLFYKFYVK